MLQHEFTNYFKIFYKVFKRAEHQFNIIFKWDYALVQLLISKTYNYQQNTYRYFISVRIPNNRDYNSFKIVPQQIATYKRGTDSSYAHLSPLALHGS